MKSGSCLAGQLIPHSAVQLAQEVADWWYRGRALMRALRTGAEVWKDAKGATC